MRMRNLLQQDNSFKSGNIFQGIPKTELKLKTIPSVRIVAVYTTIKGNDKSGLLYR